MHTTLVLLWAGSGCVYLQAKMAFHVHWNYAYKAHFLCIRPRSLLVESYTDLSRTILSHTHIRVEYKSESCTSLSRIEIRDQI